MNFAKEIRFRIKVYNTEQDPKEKEKALTTLMHTCLRRKSEVIGFSDYGKLWSIVMVRLVELVATSSTDARSDKFKPILEAFMKDLQQCKICLCPDGDLLPCGHFAHWSCMRQKKSMTCPQCKVTFDQDFFAKMYQENYSLDEGQLYNLDHIQTVNE